ncbi:DNA replication and repair protein RecF [Acinetobacter baumannii]|nr:DNA replication and repair protein RecF [Acinetobacter baumannii]
MHLTRLNIERVRNLKTVALHGLQPFNVFYGANGSGKTSILEAIHLLATGRSFRTHIPKNYIQYEADDAIVFAQSATEKIGMQKLASGEQLMKVNGDTVATQGQLAKLLPLQHIDPQSTDIIDHGAKPRRQLLDWLMFHVEPEFYFAWQYYSRALKQRNTLLKTRRNLSLADLEPWNKMLSDYGEILHSQRLSIVEQWNVYFQNDLSQLLPDLEIELEYSPGFHTEQGLMQDLLNQHPVVLLDDLTAELDLTAQQRLIERLSQLGSQVFMTTLDHASVKKHLHDLSISYQLFSVESGQVSLAAP